MDGRDILHIIIVLLHMISSIIATVLAFKCDVQSANQQATIPFALELPTGMDELVVYRGGYPWGQDGNYAGITWNPYVLIVTFEWITATFAICNLKHLLNDAANWSCVWMSIGCFLLITWSCLHYDSLCLFMSGVLFLSYLATFMICEYFAEVHGARLTKKAAPVAHHTPVHHNAEPKVTHNKTAPPVPNQAFFLVETSTSMMDGRKWCVWSRFECPWLETDLSI